MSQMIDWIPSIVTSSIIAICIPLILFFSKSFIENWITSYTRNMFDAKIEKLRSELRQKEVEIQSDLDNKTKHIESLRQGALSGITNRYSALYKRRIQAVDELWGGVLAISKYKFACNILQSVNIDKASKLAEDDGRVRNFFKLISDPIDLNKIEPNDGENARPYVTPMVWALYVAYKSTIWQSVLQLHFTRNGIGTDFIDSDLLKKTLIAALPEYESFINEHGTSSSYFLLETIESKLVLEIQSMLLGSESDIQSVEQASEIISYTDKLKAQYYSRVQVSDNGG